MKAFGKIIVLAGFSALITTSLRAELVLWQIRASVDWISLEGVTTPDVASVEYGDTFELTFLADTKASPYRAWPDFASFWVLNARATLGNLDLDLSDTLGFTVANGGESHAFFYSGNEDIYTVNFSLSGAPGYLPLAIPFSIDELVEYDVVSVLSLNSFSPERHWQVWATINEVNLIPVSPNPVPEASTFGLSGALAAIGLIVIRSIRKRRALSPRLG